MSLRSKTLAVTSLTLIGLVLVTQLAAWRILSLSFDLIEREVAAGQVRRITDRLTAEQHELDDRATQWAAWDEARAFVRGQDPGFAERYLAGGRAAGPLRLDLVAFLDTEGRLRFAWLAEPGQEAAGSGAREGPGPAPGLDPETRLRLARWRETVDAPGAGVRGGMTKLGGRPILVALAAIPVDGEHGPPAGTVIIGRYLERALALEGPQTAGIPVGLEPPEADTPGDRAVAGAPAALRLRALDGETLEGRVMVAGLVPGDRSDLSLRLPRPIRRSALATQGLLALSTVLVGLIFTIVVMLLLERLVLARLKRLSAEVAAVDPAGGLEARVAVRGRDELADLARAINRFLDDLARSVAERRRALDQARALAAAAQAASRAKSSFLAQMSHEIRTPMNAILGMASLLRSTPLTHDQDDAAEMIAESGRTLLGLLDQILDYVKLESGRVLLHEVDFALAELVAQAQATVAAEAVAKGLALSTRIDPGLAPHWRADAGRIRQILVNLIANAVRYTDHGSVQVTVSAEPGPGTGAHLHFRVCDTGIGIPADQLELVFEAFAQVESGSARRHDGSGLGLAIARELCNLLGGRIWAESQPGRGSTFHVSIPARPSPEGLVAHDGRPGLAPAGAPHREDRPAG